jgi:hypothetical protein
LVNLGILQIGKIISEQFNKARFEHKKGDFQIVLQEFFHISRITRRINKTGVGRIFTGPKKIRKYPEDFIGRCTNR